MYIFYHRNGPRREMTRMYMWGHTGMQTFLCNYEKSRAEKRCRQSCTDVCALSNQGEGLDVKRLAHKLVATEEHTCLHTIMEIGGEDMYSQVDMHSCTEVCTHSNQGFRTDKCDWDKHKGQHRSSHTSTQVWEVRQT